MLNVWVTTLRVRRSGDTGYPYRGGCTSLSRSVVWHFGVRLGANTSKLRCTQGAYCSRETSLVREASDLVSNQGSMYDVGYGYHP